jgi:rubrerythrin
MSKHFCKNCNNSYDLTKDAKLIEQVGGEKISDVVKSFIDYAITEAKHKKELKEASDKKEKNKEKDISEEPETPPKEEEYNENEGEEYKISPAINMNFLIKSPAFKKLNSEQRETVINKFNELQPKSSGAKRKKPRKAPEENEVFQKSDVYLICRNCGYNEPLKAGTLIYSQSIDSKVTESLLDDYRTMCDNPILPHTKAYICHNKKCSTIKEPATRDAVMFRKDAGFQLIYVCCICKTFWDN